MAKPIPKDFKELNPEVLGPDKIIKFQGGANTRVNKVNIPLGGFSMVQNMIQLHPGMEKRKGCAELHTTADGSNQVKTLFPFSKGRKNELHFYAQMGDGDVLEATNNPPTKTTGAFGTEVFSGSSNDIPASWGVIDDILIYSNGVDQHQLYSGDARPVDAFIVYYGSAAIPNIPEGGNDYSIEVYDDDSSTVAVLDSLGDLSTDYDAVFIKCSTPADAITFTVTKANSTAAVAQMHYWNGAWTAVSGFTDGTAVSGATLAQSGSMSWTMATDELPHYLFGQNGFWYRLSLSSGDLDSEVEISTVTYESDWISLINMWDGIPVDIVEAKFYVDADGVYKTFSASSIELDSMTSSDKMYFASAYPIVGIYADVGDKPNTTASTTVNALYYWNGSAWTAVSSLDDGTSGLSRTGWITFAPQTDVQPRQFETSRYQAYWYYFTVDQTFNDDVIISLQTMPKFDINEIGRKGICNAVWKDRACYVPDKAPNYIYVSAVNQPLVLNGDDSAILKAGDGRVNKIRCMKLFYNELMVWQEEKGKEGGCVTLFQGNSPSNFGKLVLSTQVGTFNAKSAVVVDGVTTGTRTEERIKTIAYFLSRHGVFACDGVTVYKISQDIDNYFDPNQDECIRRGYEDEMWIEHDRTRNALRVGLVSGSSATVPNVFPVYDLQDGTWSFDELAQPLSCMAEVEASSGDIPIIQVGGGTDDGFVYRLNTGLNDVSTAIDAYATVEIDGGGGVLNITRFELRINPQTSGDLIVTPYIDGVAQDDITISMEARRTGEIIRREWRKVSLMGNHISFRIRNAVASQSMRIEDMVVWGNLVESR